MRFTASLVAASLVSLTIAAPASPTATDVADVLAAQATAKSESPTSNVKGKAFDRYVSIWFENTDYDMAAADPNFQYFAKQGVTLENLFCATHPSEPNYMASASGDYFGLNGDAMTTVPSNVSTVVDLLEDKGISWAYYQEDMPYTGFQGFSWVNQVNGANDYVRKHNPGILFDSVTSNPSRLEKIKNTTLFYQDLAADKLPQWMFITPNMTSDGHDTSVTTAGVWLKNFLTPLLTDKKFMKNTLILITFDENETYTIQNRVFSVLLGDALPSNLQGTTDSSFYDHYSELSTVEANWGLHTLGRWDVGANVFKFVAAKTGDVVKAWNPLFAGGKLLSGRYFNLSYPGIFSTTTWAPQPVPNVLSFVNGRTTLPAIIKTWALEEYKNYYLGQLEVPDGLNPPVYPFSW